MFPVGGQSPASDKKHQELLGQVGTVLVAESHLTEVQVRGRRGWRCLGVMRLKLLKSIPTLMHLFFLIFNVVLIYIYIQLYAYMLMYIHIRCTVESILI